MFRLFQLDPETSAININMGAIERHKYSDSLVSIIDAFRQNRLHELWRTLNRYPDTEERAYALLVLSQLMHELKHFVDILLTPYGFHRLRTAFEFYRVLPSLLARDEPLVLPLSSGTDSFICERLGVSDYEKTLSAAAAVLVTNRAGILAAENKQHEHESGAILELGGDAILEALAFGYQVEWLQHPPINTPSLRRLMPYAFNREPAELDAFETSEISQIDLTYRWHFSLTKIFTQETTIDAQRLMYVILFASLCGSFAKDAKYVGISLDNPRAINDVFPGRVIDDRLPSNRLQQLLAWTGNFVEKGGKVPEGWQGAWALVNQGHREVWGNDVADEIEADVRSDERLISDILMTDPSYMLDASPARVFVDLVKLRRAMLDRVRKDPESLLHPFRLARVADEFITLPMYYLYPTGADVEPRVGRVVLEEYLRVPESWGAALAANLADISWPPNEGKVLAQKVAYSTWEMKKGINVVADVGAERAWPTLLGNFAPIYKLALYGTKYRTILEYDLFMAKSFLERNKRDIRWHEFYLSVEDISSSFEYFHFYGLREAQCDLCSALVEGSDSVIVSAATVRSSPEFVKLYRESMGDEEAEYFGLGRDWSVWLLCNSCRRSLA